MPHRGRAEQKGDARAVGELDRGSILRFGRKSKKDLAKKVIQFRDDIVTAPVFGCMSGRTANIEIA